MGLEASADVARGVWTGSSGGGLGVERGGLEQHARGVAPPVASDPAADRVGRPPPNAQRLEPGAVHGALVECAREDVQRPVGDRPVELGCGGAAVLGQEQGLVAVVAEPASAGRPVGRGLGSGEARDRRHEAPDVRCAAVQHVRARVGGDQVRVLVRVHEGRQHGAVRQRPRLGVHGHGGPNLGQPADGHNAPFRNPDRLHRGPVVTHVDRYAAQDHRLSHARRPPAVTSRWAAEACRLGSSGSRRSWPGRCGRFGPGRTRSARRRGVRRAW